MTQAKPRFTTIEEYLEYDDGTNDSRCELVRGELVEMPPESRLNQRIASFLFETFIRLGISSEFLTIGVQIAVSSQEATVRQPDFVVLSPECAIALDGATTALITLGMLAPALVVEVVSPGNPGTENYDRDYVEKPKEYAARGIPEFWRVDPSRAVVAVLVLIDGSYRVREFRGADAIASPTFSQFQLTAEQILSAGQES
jgi:Uma2 family endonuclease